MTLVVVVKCTDGLVLAADSRSTGYRFDPEVPESDRTVFDDKSRKLFSFRAPFDNVGVLSFDYHGISAGFIGEEEEIVAQIQRYSIEVCMRRFKERLYETHPKKPMTVHQFKRRLKMFLIEHWQHYRERRRSFLHRMNEYTHEHMSKQPDFVPPSTLEVKLLVAGLNKGEKEGHVFPILLTDDDKEWDGSRYSCILDYVEMIPRPCGIYCDGVIDFAIPILAADDPMESIKQLQQDNIETTVAEIADIKTRFSINYVQIPNQRPFFSGNDIAIYDGTRIAQLLIGGTADYLGERGGVGGATRICTINPLRGTKCRSRA